MNAFATYSEATKPGHVARQERISERAVAKRSLSLLEKQKEQAKINKVASLAEREEMAAIMASPDGPAMTALRTRLRGMTIAEGPKVLVFIEASPLRQAPAQTRYIALKLVSRAICRARIKENLPAFDDGLPGDAPKAFQVIKQMLGVV